SPRARGCAATGRCRDRCAARSRAPPTSRPSAAPPPCPSSVSGGALEARDAALASQRHRQLRQLRPVGAAAERGAQRLEQLAPLDAETAAGELERGFNPGGAPVRKPA